MRIASEPRAGPPGLSRREFLGAAAAAAAAAAVPGCRRPPEGPPSIVVVLADQLRADVLGCYGGRNIETPALDRLAREGILFENALSPHPLCTPYRGMLMSGRHPTHSGVLANRVEFSPVQNPDTLGTLFARAGYHTGYLGKWHLAAGTARLGRFRGDREGRSALLEENPHLEFVPPGPGRLGFQHWRAYNYHGDANAYWYYGDTPEKILTGRYETDVLVEQAIGYLDERRRDGRPFLLIVSPHPPHPPFDPAHCPEGYLEQVTPDPLLPPNVPPDSKILEDPLPARCYLAMARHLDDCVGRLVRHLDQSGLAQRTALVFTADHGEMLQSHGAWGKQLPYRESVRVPLLVRQPGSVAAGQRSDALHTPMDHLPTLCALAGIATPDYLDGHDFSAVLGGDGATPRDAVLLMNPISSRRGFDRAGPIDEWRGVRTARHTYVRWLEGAEELYDDREDPHQLRNLARDDGAQPALEELRERLWKLMEEAHDALLPGAAYSGWYDEERRLLRTALGEVPSF